MESINSVRNSPLSAGNTNEYFGDDVVMLNVLQVLCKCYIRSLFSLFYLKYFLLYLLHFCSWGIANFMSIGKGIQSENTLLSFNDLIPIIILYEKFDQRLLQQAEEKGTHIIDNIYSLFFFFFLSFPNNIVSAMPHC